MLKTTTIFANVFEKAVERFQDGINAKSEKKVRRVQKWTLGIIDISFRIQI